MSRYDDRPPRVELPPPNLISHTVIRDLADEYDRLSAAILDANTTLVTQRDDHQAALENEETARITAIREGKAQPTTKTSDKLRHDIEAQERTIEATEAAREQARRELVQAVEEHRSEWKAKLEEQHAGARETYLSAVEALEAAHRQLAELANLRAWATTFPDLARWRPDSYYRNVKGLPGRGSEETLDFESAVAALRDVGAPPPPPAPPPQHIPPGGRQSGRVPRQGIPQVDVAHGPLRPSTPPDHWWEADGGRVSWGY